MKKFIDILDKPNMMLYFNYLYLIYFADLMRKIFKTYFFPDIFSGTHFYDEPKGNTYKYCAIYTIFVCMAYSFCFNLFKNCFKRKVLMIIPD